MKLNDLACKGAKPKDKQYKKFDGGGLYLLVKHNGSKLWQLKYRYLGKEKTLSLGAYPLISLAQAREGRDDAKRLLLKNTGFGEDMVAHATIREKLKIDAEIIERQLAHKASGALGEAYDRTQFLDERAVMMQDWADYVDGLK